MMQYHIGTDIGTSAVKTVAFGADGSVLASVSHTVSTQQPQPGHSEQDPELVLQAVQQGLQEVLTAMAPDAPQFISFSAAMHGLILVDERDQAITPCITWADQRAGAIAGALRQTEQGRAFYQLTGVPVHSMSPFCKLIWFREHAPALFSSTARFTGIKEYVLHRLSGEYFIDSSSAAATGWMNGRTLQWDAAILAYAGIAASQLSRIVAPDHAVPSVAVKAIPALAPGTLICAGASDGACAVAASGMDDSSTMSVTIGTSAAARVMTKGFGTDAYMRTFCYHVKEDRYISGGASNNGAVVLDWLRDQILQRSDFPALLQEAAALEPGAEGLIFLPYLQGERAPIWKADARAVYFGLTMRHGPAHLLRAAMEAVCFAVWGTGRILQERDGVNRILASGGAAVNAGWMQMLADYTGLPVFASDHTEASALGAVLLADPQAIQLSGPAPGRQFRPDPERHRIYQQHFHKATRLYTILAAEMDPPDDK